MYANVFTNGVDGALDEGGDRNKTGAGGRARGTRVAGRVYLSLTEGELLCDLGLASDGDVAREVELLLQLQALVV